ncbi:MAG: tRNA 2-thiouridine(34) synthase MnmA [Patescibacteria group bacterium]|nr:tRNA 2-thiouridine(34) synthase MnmA [Patescibacteria group bacterium]
MKKRPGKKKKVYVGMSGGVDSSVAAALLRGEGHEVVGVFIKITDFNEEWGIECTWREERREAMRAAAHLDIPLLTIDLSKEYKDEVVDYMVGEYRAGRTPNPDVMCNQEIKFGAFFDWAMKRAGSADWRMATGHYARSNNLDIECPSQNESLGHSMSKFKLLRGKDPAKDQSYFLWILTQAELEHCLFPIGKYKKEAVRKLARKFGLPNAEKKDSQGLCFIGQLSVKDFLKKFIPEKRGQVLNEKGGIIGRHDGAVFCTIGERHGFTITKKTSGDKPYYVVAKDIKKNQLVVAHNLDGNLDIECPSQNESLGHSMSKWATLTNINWISGASPDSGKTYQAQVRYHGELYECRVDGDKVEFLKPPPALALGQSCVIYDKQKMLGGGVIGVYTIIT